MILCDRIRQLVFSGKKAALLRSMTLTSACLLCMTGCGIGHTTYKLDTDAFRTIGALFSVNGTKCPTMEAELYYYNYRTLYGTAYGLEVDEDSQEAFEEYVKSVAVDEIVRIYYMDLIGEEEGIQLDDDEDAMVEQVAAEYYASLSKEDAKEMNLTERNLEEYYTHYALADKVYQTLTSNMDIEISEDRARVVRVQMICVDDVDSAYAITEGLADGKDFNTLASTYSTMSLKEFTVVRGDYEQAIEDAMYALDDDECSEMIVAEDGCYYFVRMINKYEENLTAANKLLLAEEAKSAEYYRIYEEYEADAKLCLNQTRYKNFLNHLSDDVSTGDFFNIYNDWND